MSLVLMLVTFRGYFPSRGMTDVSDQDQEVTISTQLKTGPALPHTFQHRSSSLFLCTSSERESFRQPALTHSYPYHLLISFNVSSIFPSPQFNYVICYATRSDQYHISSFFCALAAYIKSVWNFI